jgi:P27 family predicted phage terminase small subunit
MGKRGPKGKPREIHMLNGNPSRRALVPDDEVVTCDMPPVMPVAVSLNDRATEAWEHTIACMPPELYSAADVALLTTHALAWAMFLDAQDDIAAHGIIIEEETYGTEGQLLNSRRKANPSVAIWHKASDTLLKTADRLALTPAVRGKLSLPRRGEKPAAPISRFAGLIPHQN